MFRKLSVAALLVLASGALAQKKTTKVEFCAVPTPEGSRLSVTGTGVFQVGGAAFPPAGTTLPAVSSIVSGPTFFNPVGNYMSPLLPGACPAAGAARIGTWEAACDVDFYEPVVQRLADLPVAAAAAFPTAAQLQAACEAAAVPTPVQTGVNNALCSSQIQVSENAATKGFSKFGSSLFYNYVPTITYSLIGGYMNQNFGPAVAPAGGADVERYCIYWPTTNPAIGKSAGGTNKLAKPLVKDVATTLGFTNAPAGGARYLDLAAAIAAPAGLPKAAVGPLTPPTFQETVAINYHKNGPLATQL